MSAREDIAPGIVQVRRCLDAATCADACAAVEEALERARRGRVDAADWSPTSSSLRYAAVAALPPDALSVIDALLRALGRDLLGLDVSCDLESSWWRRQYPPHLAPPLHGAHSWHQDGALGFDFLAHPEGSADARALRQVVTCWIALTPCGREAPSLELLAASTAGVLGLDALDDRALRRAHPAECLVRPVLDAGDALVFGGAVPHRTHVAPSMQRSRTSVELRAFGDGVSPPQVCVRRSAT